MKNNNTMLVYLISAFFLVLICAGSCDKDPILAEKFYTIEIQNKSSDTISPYLAIGGEFTQYPDTMLPINRPALLTVSPSKSTWFDSREEWKNKIEKLKADTLSIFIIKTQTYNDSSWTDIRNKYLILKRYDFSCKDLEDMNWTITYP